LIWRLDRKPERGIRIIDVGCETAMEAYAWVKEKVYGKPVEPTESVIWTGKDNMSPPDIKEYNNGN
jgi:hypothetical protein